MCHKTMSMNQAASYLNRSRVTLYKWNTLGYLPFHHVGTKPEYEAIDVVRVKHPTFNAEQLNEEIKTLP